MHCFGLAPSVLAFSALSLLSAAAEAQQVQGMASSQSSLDAGGLKPPEAIDTEEQAPGPTEGDPAKELERADREDAGRGLEYVWLNAELGGQHFGLRTLSDKQLVDPARVATTQTGLTYGGGVGARILNYTVGARFRFGSFSEWKLWTLGLEGQFRIPLGRLEPYATVFAGYASVGSFTTDDAVASQAQARGFDARLGAGVDYYLTNTFSLGASFSGDFLFLSRAAVSAPDAEAPRDETYADDGSSIGAGAALTAVVGLHF